MVDVMDKTESTKAFDDLIQRIRSQAPLKEIQVLYAAYVVAESGGNKVRASVKLGIDRRTIQRWGVGPKFPPRR